LGDEAISKAKQNALASLEEDLMKYRKELALYMSIVALYVDRPRGSGSKATATLPTSAKR